MTSSRTSNEIVRIAREILASEGLAGISFDAIARRLLRPQHDDPFVDAYVRWQLTGFDPPLPVDGTGASSDREFSELLESLPPLVRNPRSEPALVATVNRLLARERVSESEAGAIAETNRELRAREAAMRNLSRPALQLRLWFERTLNDAGDNIGRVFQTRLNRLRALVEAGWGVERLKREIERDLDGAQRDLTFTPEQRDAVAARARRLVGLRTPIVTRIAAPDGVPQADFDETAVYDFEVRAWLRALAGR